MVLPSILKPQASVNYLFHLNNSSNYLHNYRGGVSKPLVVKGRLEPPSTTVLTSPPFSSLALRPLLIDPSPSDSHDSRFLTSSIGSPTSVPSSQWNLDRKHIHLLNLIACAVAVSASWLFFSAIPALLAFKRAAESLEKLLDVTAEELPDTMAAVRLSGMEISDLTMELSDLGQEITQGVRSSTRAVRLAEERLRRLTTMPPTVSVQGQTTLKNETEGPVLARTARNMREGIVKGRAVLGIIFSITQFSRWALNILAARGRKRSV